MAVEDALVRKWNLGSRMELAVEVLDQVMAGNAMRLIGDNDGLAGPCAG